MFVIIFSASWFQFYPFVFFYTVSFSAFPVSTYSVLMVYIVLKFRLSEFILKIKYTQTNDKSEAPTNIAYNQGTLLINYWESCDNSIVQRVLSILPMIQHMNITVLLASS